MKKRKLGNKSDELTVVGFGGIIVMNATAEEASSAVSEAVEKRGINYFDVAPSYGNAQEMLGPALEPYRDSVFLACKTGKRDAEGAEIELNRSLELLRTDHFDVYQLHGVTTLEEVDQIFSPGGAIETFIKARDQGMTRYLGFSAHSEEAALALMERFDFDTILFPFNWAAWYQNGFGKKVLPVANEKGMGIFALKALAKRAWKEGEEHEWDKTWYKPVESYEEAKMGLQFTLSLPVTAAVSPGHAELLWWACDAAEDLAPMTDEEAAQAEALSQGLEVIFPVNE